MSIYEVMGLSLFLWIFMLLFAWHKPTRKYICVFDTGASIVDKMKISPEKFSLLYIVLGVPLQQIILYYIFSSHIISSFILAILFSLCHSFYKNPFLICLGTFILAIIIFQCRENDYNGHGILFAFIIHLVSGLIWIYIDAYYKKKLIND